MFLDQTECTKPALHAHEWPVHMLLLDLFFPIIAIIVRFCVAALLNLRTADHETMIMRNRANLRSARAAYDDCIRAVLMSILALLV